MLMAGIGRACITPPLDTPSGLFVAQKHILADGLHQDLWVTVLILSDGQEKIAMLDFDYCLLSDAQTADIRSEVARSTGIDSTRIFPFCTHSHAGPVTYQSYSGPGEDRVKSYFSTVPSMAAGAARQASLNLVPVRVAAGTGISQIGINRDLPMEDGRMVCGPNPDGFCNNEVGVIRMDLFDGTPLVCIVNYACHPTVLGPANKLISPDYPGSTKRMVERVTGATCIFLQGAGGNIGPVEGFVGDVTVAERLGNLLGLEASKVFISLSTSPIRKKLHEVLESGAPLTQYIDEPIEVKPDELRLISRMVSLPFRKPLSDLFEKAEERLANWLAELEQMRKTGGQETEVAIIKLHQKIERVKIIIERLPQYRNNTHKMNEMHVIGIGPIAMVVMGNEPYNEIGVEVKLLSPFEHTLFAAYLCGDSAYIPAPDVYLPQSPFEVEISPYSPDAAQVVVSEAISMLYELKSAD